MSPDHAVLTNNYSGVAQELEPGKPNAHNEIRRQNSSSTHNMIEIVFIGFLIVIILLCICLTIRITNCTPFISKEKSRPAIRSSKQKDVYAYEPLQGAFEIRLLILDPGSRDSDISCKLRRCNLSRDVPSYKAISYVWGSTQTTHKILCNGRNFNITTNLKNALQRVRSPSRKIYLWVDAICINQEDLRERKMQVGIMRHIFANASSVIICLGEQAEFSTEQLRDLRLLLGPVDPEQMNEISIRSDQPKPVNGLIFGLFPGILKTKRRTQRTVSNSPIPKSQPRRCLSPKTRALLNGTQTVERRSFTTPTNLSWKNPPDWSPSTLKLVAHFFDNPWFSRIWVVQEVAESKNALVLLGGLEVPWQNVVQLAKTTASNVKNMNYLDQISKSNGLRNALFMNSQNGNSGYDPIPMLLQSTRDFGASDPRDKVYAMLHRPLRKPRRYMDARFIEGSSYLKCLLQCVSVQCISAMLLDHDVTDPQFWLLFLSLIVICHNLGLHHSISLHAFDFSKRFFHFVLKLERILLFYFDVTDTMGNMLDIIADYSLTVQSVYRSLATKMIKRSRNLNILSYVNHGNEIDSTYPSWVPRWDCPSGGVQVLVSFAKHSYRASAEMEHMLDIPSTNTDHLKVEGIVFSTIRSLSDVLNATKFPTLGSAYLELKDVEEPTATTNPLRKDGLTEKSLRRAYIATLTAGRLGHTHASHLPYGMHDLQKQVAATLRVCYGKRLFVTDNGHLGIGPAAMHRGDTVCVLFGGSVPYVLRPTDTDGLYRLVGEGYVHDIMQGELIELWKRGQVKKKSIVLC